MHHHYHHHHYCYWEGTTLLAAKLWDKPAYPTIITIIITILRKRTCPLGVKLAQTKIHHHHHHHHCFHREGTCLLGKKLNIVIIIIITIVTEKGPTGNKAVQQTNMHHHHRITVIITTVTEKGSAYWVWSCTANQHASSSSSSLSSQRRDLLGIKLYSKPTCIIIIITIIISLSSSLSSQRRDLPTGSEAVQQTNMHHHHHHHCHRKETCLQEVELWDKPTCITIINTHHHHHHYHNKEVTCLQHTCLPQNCVSIHKNHPNLEHSVIFRNTSANVSPHIWNKSGCQILQENHRAIYLTDSVCSWKRYFCRSRLIVHQPNHFATVLRTSEFTQVSPISSMVTKGHFSWDAFLNVWKYLLLAGDDFAGVRSIHSARLSFEHETFLQMMPWFRRSIQLAASRMQCFLWRNFFCSVSSVHVQSTSKSRSAYLFFMHAHHVKKWLQ